MGRGDRKTRKGKIAIRSYGNKRPADAAAKQVGATKGTAVKKTAATGPAKTAAAKRPAAPAKKAAAPARKS